ncbi:uncharacterized protein LOC106079858 [Biomphalaria glabrata]|uniref:Uncharacterized protein LOC106079858 n=1 Tax=Biomphalaria glabrata TaxID=6526 RepID=A0A9W2YHM0_BIOGL|nr:uncharacterized protein LOC106079858 [Biomphalaria glabrata]
MGNCLDVTPDPLSKGVKAGHLRSSGAHSRSAPSFGGSTHSLLRTSAFPPYSLPGHLVPAYATTSAPSIPSFYQPVHPSFYQPMHMHYLDDFWTNGFTSDNFEEVRRHKKYRKVGADSIIEDVTERQNKVNRKYLNSVIITTSLNPNEDVIKGGSQIITSGKAPLIQSGVMSNKKTVVTSTVPAPPRADKVAQPKNTFDTLPQRGSTYITYIEDDPKPAPPADELSQQEAEVLSVESGFKDIADEEDGVFKIFVDDHPKTSAADATKTAATSSGLSLQSVLMSYGAAPTLFRPSDVVLCFGSHEAVAVKIQKTFETAGVSVCLSKCSPLSSKGDSTTSAHAVIESKVMVVLLSLESIKMRSLRDQVCLAHVSETSVFPVTLDQSLDIITSMDMGLKLQLSSYKWTELHNGGFFDLTMSKLVRSVRDEVNIIRGFEIIDEDYGQVSSMASRQNKSIKQQLLTRSVDLITHATAWDYWLAHYADQTEASWDRFLRDIHASYHELLTCSIPKSTNSHFNKALKRELLDTASGMVHKSTFIEFCKELGTDRDVWEKLHTVARETQASLDIFSPESSVRAAALNKLGKLFNPYLTDVVRELLKDKDPVVRAVSAVALSQYAMPDDRVTHAAILTTLDDLNSLVREAGCKAACHLNSHQALEKLHLLSLTDSSDKVREAATQAIKEIREH